MREDGTCVLINVWITNIHVIMFSGVFYIIYGGQVLSLVILILEWIVKCASVVDKNDPLVSRIVYLVLFELSIHGHT